MKKKHVLLHSQNRSEKVFFLVLAEGAHLVMCTSYFLQETVGR